MEQNELSFSGMTYLEAICRLFGRTGCVHSADVANDLQVSRPSVTRAVKLLSNEGLIQKNSRDEIVPTQNGLSAAEELNEKYITIKTFFSRTIGNCDLSFRETIKLSYFMSDKIVRAIRTYLQSGKSAQSVNRRQVFSIYYEPGAAPRRLRRSFLLHPAHTAYRGEVHFYNRKDRTASVNRRP